MALIVPFLESINPIKLIGSVSSWLLIFPLASIYSLSPSLTCSNSLIRFCFDHLKIMSLILWSKLYKNLKPVFKIFLLESEKPKLGTSSFVSLTIILGLYFLHISATSLTVTVSFVKLKVSDKISSLSSMLLKHLATSTKGTKLFICLPPAKSFKVPFCDAILENKFGIISIRAVSVEYP